VNSTRETTRETLQCYRCGHSLAELSLPLSRLDECPQCRVHLHVCRMCTNYAPRRPTACREDDAPEVRDKTTANFCDYFRPRAGAFDGAAQAAEARARSQLDALFGAPAAEPANRGPDATDPALDSAHSLFKKT
jgi:hypothetical protein